MTHGIKCGHCSTRNRAVYHESVRDVAFCGFTRARANLHAANSTKASAEVAKAAVQQSRPNEWTFKVPEGMVKGIKDGRYAIPVGDNTDLIFLRVSRPTHGKKRGCIVVQTQHSDWYQPAVIWYPTGSVWIAQHGERVEQGLLAACINPIECAIRYSSELGVCSSCGRELTDARSRWYGIGPECEKRWPGIIRAVDGSLKGPFRGY